MAPEQTIVYKLGGLSRPHNTKLLRILFKLNKIPIISSYIRKQLLYHLHLPDSVSINQGFYCSAPNIEVGENTGLGNTYILAWARVKIGKGCSFSFNNMIITSTHDFVDFSTVVAKPVTIGDNVWVTSNVTILPGVTIGSNTVIGAGSVVTRDIPSGVFAAGNPCRVIKQIEFKKHEQ